jgi:putrescine aminotransferase
MTAPRTRELQEVDRRHHLHPFTIHDELHAQGTHIVSRGEGVYLHDSDGRRLLDGLAGLWCVNVGYGRREIADAIHRQVMELSFYPSFFNNTTEPAIRLAERLAQLAPGRLTHTAFSNSGSEANETALKLLRWLRKLEGRPQKTKILTRTFAYHGVTLATTSMTGLPSCYQPFDLPLPGYLHVPGPHSYGARTSLTHDDYGRWCLRETERIIEQEDPGTISALFAEPVQGAGGVIVPPDGYLRELRELCRRHDILFVADEVISGFGRLGEWFASTLWDLDPDLLILAKGLTSGYVPLGATMVSREIADRLVHGGYFAHGFTYSGHPVSCAAALANLEIIEREHLVPRVRKDIGPYFQERLRRFASHRAVGDVRGLGLIGALDLVPSGGREALTPHSNLGVKAARLARERGAVVRGIRDLIAIAPPLTITAEQIDELFDAVGQSLDALWD